jgi:predicted KAP-like P-loop ATPase
VYGDSVGLEGTGLLSLISDHIRFASWLLFDVLKLLGESRYSHLMNAMDGAPAIYTVVSVSTTFEQALTRPDKDFALKDKFGDLSAEVVSEIVATAVRTIRTSASNEKLMNVPRLPTILFQWRRWTNREEVDAWVKTNFLQTPLAAVGFVSRFVSKATSAGMNDKVSKVTDRIAFGAIAEFTDLHVLADLVKQANEAALNDSEIDAKRLFLRGVQKLDSGKTIDALDSPIGF